jgi:hypothetical protein
MILRSRSCIITIRSVAVLSCQLRISCQLYNAQALSQPYCKRGCHGYRISCQLYNAQALSQPYCKHACHGYRISCQLYNAQALSQPWCKHACVLLLTSKLDALVKHRIETGYGSKQLFGNLGVLGNGLHSLRKLVQRLQ